VRADLHDVMLQMRHALDMMPCACCRRWNKEAEDGYDVTKVCIRCRAVRAYEALVHPPVVTL
jgi:hypothetical protein